MDLSIVIVTWNSAKEIEACIRSIQAAATGLSTEIFVIDNHSTDLTKLILQEINGVHTIYNEANHGFAAAVNQGIGRSTGEYVLLLNPDTVLEPESLSSMHAYLRAHPDVGVAGGKVVNHDGSLQPSIRRFPTLLDQSVILLKLHRFFPKLVSRYFAEGFNYEKEQDVDQVRGAFFFISRKALEKIGPLDEKNFFIWFEEVDFCKRVKDAGLAVRYVPGPTCRHAGGASFAQALSVQKQRWMNRSMLNYFKKHDSTSAYVILSAIAPVSIALAYLASFVPARFKKYV